MDSSNKSLVLNVNQAGQVRQFIVRKGGKFTLGRRRDNDLTLNDQRYPKRYTLISQKNGAFRLHVSHLIEGEIAIESSKLLIRDLIQHDILPREGNTSLIKLTPNKQGVLTVGDIKIEFLFKSIKIPQSVALPPSHLEAFSWSRATIKNLTQDLLFKFIFLILFLINSLILYAFKDYVAHIEPKFDMTKIPERLARFIIRPTKEMIELEGKTLAANIENMASNSDSKSSSEKNAPQRTQSGRKGSGRGNPAGSTGLLGLLAGTGSSGQTSSLVDALVDRGLVADLNNIIGGGSHLKVTPNGEKNTTDLLDQLIGTGGSGGIDDFLAGMEEEVPQVTLTKKAKVDLVKPSKMTGSKEALGQRTEQSIWAVVSSREGNIKYLYEKHLKRNPSLRGKITIEFTIAANGFIIEAKIIESTLNNPELEYELLALIKRLRFEPIPSGNVTTIFPFVFSKVN